MKRVGVIMPLGLDPVIYFNSEDEFHVQLSEAMEKARQNLAITFPGVRFMVTALGAAPIAFEFDDDDEPLTDRILPMPETVPET